MFKKWKKCKSKVFAVLLSAVCLISTPMIDVSAATNEGSVINDLSVTFPILEGATYQSNTFTQSKSFNITLPVPPQVGKFYIITIVGTHNISNNWTYSTNDLVSLNYIYRYGGKEYTCGPTYNQCFLIEGMNTGVLGLEIVQKTTITPLWNVEYQEWLSNSLTTSLTWTPTIYVHSYTADELAEAKQLVQIVNLLQESALSDEVIRTNILKILLSNTKIENKLSDLYDLMQEVYTQSESDSQKMEDFKGESAMQGNQLNALNQQNQVNKIDINNASTSVDSNIDLNAVGSSGVVLSALTSQSKILTMLLGVTAVSLIAYVFFGKR